MHYKNGREAKVGDRILSVDSGGWHQLGIVTKIYDCSATCNLLIVPLRNQVCVTAKECVHVDDAFSLTQGGLPAQQPVTSPAAPIPGASPAIEEVQASRDSWQPPAETVARNLPPAVVETLCPDCGNNDGTHTKGCAQYR